MDRLCSGASRRLEQAVDVQVAFRRRGRTDRYRLFRRQNVRRKLVRLGIDGDGRYAELLAGSHDAKRDFTPVCDEDLLEHALSGLGFQST